MARISQREARSLRKRVDELTAEINSRRYAWASEYPGGVHLGSVDMVNLPVLFGQIVGARKLKHAVIVTLSPTANEIRVHALPEANR
jgi:hypothetical protein